MDEPTGWERLADAIVRRRIALGYDRRQKAFAEHAGLSDQTLGQLENARKTSYSKGTFVALETALLWAPGSVQAVIDGHDPGEYPIPVPEPEPEPALSLIDDAELLARSQEILAELSRRLLSRSPDTPQLRPRRRRYTDEEIAAMPTMRVDDTAEGDDTPGEATA